MEEDPIVICGMGCRLPGDVKSPSDFWNLIISSRSAQSDVPANRFDIDKWYHPDPKRRGGIVAKGGYFLSHDDSYRNFDPSFFGIHPLEAASMDPQQRKLLEVVWETFESAGATLDAVSGSQTACYVGAFTADFAKTLQREPEGYWPYQSTGTDMTILSNRVNYVFNLKGPSLTVDTACSSSLYALHLAIQGLLLHDFDAAVVAGTNIIMDFLHQMTATKLGILSPTSTCHTFDASADGFGRAEGITALYIKRLSDAIANGDPIRAVIRASAINTNGKGVGISHPGREGQEAVIRHAYSKAKLTFDETTYLECHGTGTPVGDPIEVAAAGDVFGPGRSAENPILLSSVKSQIGHTEGASGIAAILRVVMAMENGVVPATIGISKLNPALDLKDGRVKIVQESLRWPGGYRRAGVNSFGYGGANAHIIIDHTESYLQRKAIQLPKTWTSLTPPRRPQHKRRQLLVTSAHSPESLRQNIMSISRTTTQHALPDLAYTLSQSRTHFHHRAYAIATPDADSPFLPEHWTIDAQRLKPLRIGFVFTGQGAQWPRMGIQLVENFRVFKESFSRLQEHLLGLRDGPPWTLYEALAAAPETSLMMKDVTVTVTLCTAVQMCLVDLLKSWGIQPQAVVGHSSGEAAAAYCAGLLSASEAIITSYYRALALKTNPNPGAMMAVGLGARAVTNYLTSDREVYLACHNSSESVTISGRTSGIDELEALLKKEGIFARKVKSSGFANHSPLVEEAAQYFRQHFYGSLAKQASKSTQASGVRMYSCITGSRVDAADVGVNYWARNISAPVLFDEALQKLLEKEPDIDCLTEIGPHSALAGPIRQTKALLGMDNERLLYLPSLTRGNDGGDDMLRLAGSLHLAGYGVNIDAANMAGVRTREDEQNALVVDLPGYQWAYDKIHWSESHRSQSLLFRKHPCHDLLGSLEPSSTAATSIWRNTLVLSEVPWIADHKIGSSVLVPASAYIAMAVEAVTQMLPGNGSNSKFILKDVSISSPIRLSGDDNVETVFELSTSQRWWTFNVSSLTVDGEHTKHASGFIRQEVGENIRKDHNMSGNGPSSLKSANLYARFQQLGLNYGPCFQPLHDVDRHTGEKAGALIGLCSTQKVMAFQSRYFVHPATMDGCFQLAFAAVLSENHGTKRSYLPSAIPEMTIWSAEDCEAVNQGHVEGKAQMRGLRSVEAGFELVENGFLRMQGKVELIAVEGLVGAEENENMPEPYQRLTWLPDIDLLTGTMSVVKMLGVGQTTRTTKLEAPRSSALANGSAHGPELAKKAHASQRSSVQTLECLSKLLRLLVFKRPGSRLLEVGGTFETGEAILSAVNGKFKYPAVEDFISITRAGEMKMFLSKARQTADDAEVSRVDWSQPIVDQGVNANSIDILVVNSVPESCSWTSLLRNAKAVLSQHARLIITGEAMKAIDENNLHQELADKGFSLQVVVPEAHIALTTTAEHNRAQSTSGLVTTLWIVHETSEAIVQRFQSAAGGVGIETRAILLSDAPSLPNGAKVLALVEIEKPMIAGMDAIQMQHLQRLFKRASSVHWVTSGRDPRMALMRGMIKSLRSETPGLDLRAIHVETETCRMESAAGLILQLAAPEHDDADLEISWLIRDRNVWISRYAIDEEQNKLDLARSRGTITERIFDEGLQLDFQRIGQLESLFFRTIQDRGQLNAGFVRVRTLGFALSRQNAMTLKGMAFGHHFSHECFGIVEEVKDVSNLRRGDVVICLTGSMIESKLIAAESSCLRCSSQDEALDLIGLIAPFCHAYIALIEIARLRKGDCVLLECRDPVLQTVLAAVVDHSGAIVQPSKTDEPIALGKINIIIDAEGDLDFECHRSRLALGARLIRLRAADGMSASKREIEDVSGAMAINEIDVQNLLQMGPEYMTDTLSKAKGFFCGLEERHQPPLRVYGLDQIPKAVKYGLDSAEAQKVILKCGKDVVVPVHRIDRPAVKFSSEGSYLLIGCLGGLGRCLTEWMRDHGARRFVFLSRSGVDKPEARSLVDDLQKDPGVTIKVIRGDVRDREHVHSAVRDAACPIHGVVQAAVVYNETRFDQMTPETFHSVLSPKVIGTVNLHQVTLHEPLDFFVMLSSSIGLTGASTQTHYTAANAFLDAMAQYRRHGGLPATSLSLGMVVGLGRFEEKTGLSEVLGRRGAYGITEAEFLRMMEVACFSSQGNITGRRFIGAADQSVLVTALDPTRFSNAQAVGDIPEWCLSDARFRQIAHIVRTIDPHLLPDTKFHDQGTAHIRAKAADPASNMSDILKLVQTCMLEKVSMLVLIPAEKLESSLRRPLSELGMDSIVGTELQSWLWRELRVSLDFMELFASQMSLGSLVELVNSRLLESRGNGHLT